MKHTLFFGLTILLFSCQNAQNEEREDTEYLTEDVMDGTFANGPDSLVLHKQTDVLGDEIDFNLSAVREQGQQVVFNVATEFGMSEVSIEFRLKDYIYGDSSAAKGYSSLNFIYNYDNDNWQVIDSVVITDSTFEYKSLGINKSGIFKRVQ